MNLMHALVLKIIIQFHLYVPNCNVIQCSCLMKTDVTLETKYSSLTTDQKGKPKSQTDFRNEKIIYEFIFPNKVNYINR